MIDNQHRYASHQTFDGQRATVGRVVIVMMTGGAVTAGIIACINGEDRPLIRTLEPFPSNDGTGGATPGWGPFEFFPSKSEADLDGMPDLTWTWPPRV